MVDTVNYSVPESFVGKTVSVKKYHDEIRVFHKNILVCKHKRAFGKGTFQIDIYHYLDTFLKKPGALQNSSALKNIPKLKVFFETHYVDKPRKFIEMFIENRHRPLEELIVIFEQKTLVTQKVAALDIVRPVSEIELATLAGLHDYDKLKIGGNTNG